MPTKKYTTVTPLPEGVSRQLVLETLQNHLEMIDLNPAHSSRNRIPPPTSATSEEINCSWYEITDRFTMCPGLPQKNITFNACFHDLADGSQIHSYAPMGLDIKQKWSIAGNAPGEPAQPTEIGIGAPKSGLYIREDVELKCNFIIARFVRRTLRDALEVLVTRLLLKAQVIESAQCDKEVESGQNQEYQISLSPMSPPLSVPLNLPLSPPASPHNSTSDSDKRFPRCESKSERFSIVSESAAKQLTTKENNEWAAGAHLPENMMPVELPS